MTNQFNLWDGQIPLYIDGEEKPTITYYKAEKKSCDSAAVIFPGGGYSFRASYEGEDYALFLNSIGMDSFVVNYRVAPYLHPTQLLDARRAVRFVRANAERFGINPDRIAVMGSSAGGHLAALVSTADYEILGEGIDEIDKFSAKPNMQILCYPVTDLKSHIGSFMRIIPSCTICEFDSVTPTLLASKNTPPAFIWHTMTDEGVNPASTLEYAKRLQELGINYELHIYPVGPHGLGLANKDSRLNPQVQSWTDLLRKFLSLHGFL
jgi:acetyl esterase/lipase